MSCSELKLDNLKGFKNIQKRVQKLIVEKELFDSWKNGDNHISERKDIIPRLKKLKKTIKSNF